jgi:hypothetical protein
MRTAFPERRHPGWIDLSSALLYGAIDAYDAPPSALTNKEFITG